MGHGGPFKMEIVSGAPQLKHRYNWSHFTGKVLRRKYVCIYQLLVFLTKLRSNAYCFGHKTLILAPGQISTVILFPNFIFFYKRYFLPIWGFLEQFLVIGMVQLMFILTSTAQKSIIKIIGFKVYPVCPNLQSTVPRHWGTVGQNSCRLQNVIIISWVKVLMRNLWACYRTYLSWCHKPLQTVFEVVAEISHVLSYSVHCNDITPILGHVPCRAYRYRLVLTISFPLLNNHMGFNFCLVEDVIIHENLENLANCNDTLLSQLIPPCLITSTLCPARVQNVSLKTSLQPIQTKSTTCLHLYSLIVYTIFCRCYTHYRGTAQ